jgi:putative transposase
MPRPLRIDLPHIPQHVVQRGNDRQPCFFQPCDRLRYLDDLREISRRAGCAVHAYVLMTNHVHLLLTPSAPGQVGHVMQALGRRYVRYVNDRYRRTGTLREGRYKSCPVESDEHLLRCYRYIELNPVRAAMVADPAAYVDSSYRANALGHPDPLLTPHAQYLALGATPDLRRQVYRDFIGAAISHDELDLIGQRLQRQHVPGSDRFRVMIEAQPMRAAGPRKAGRPRKPASSADQGEIRL